MNRGQLLDLPGWYPVEEDLTGLVHVQLAVVVNITEQVVGKEDGVELEIVKGPLDAVNLVGPHYGHVRQTLVRVGNAQRRRVIIQKPFHERVAAGDVVEEAGARFRVREGRMPPAEEFLDVLGLSGKEFRRVLHGKSIAQEAWIHCSREDRGQDRVLCRGEGIVHGATGPDESVEGGEFVDAHHELNLQVRW